jgi:hypothetical protein
MKKRTYYFAAQFRLTHTLFCFFIIINNPPPPSPKQWEWRYLG